MAKVTIAWMASALCVMACGPDAGKSGAENPSSPDQNGTPAPPPLNGMTVRPGAGKGAGAATSGGTPASPGPTGSSARDRAESVDSVSQKSAEANSQTDRETKLDTTKAWQTADDVANACSAEVAVACSFLATGGRLKSGVEIPGATKTRRRELLLKACQFDQSGVICLADGVEEYLTDKYKLRDVDVEARRSAAYVFRKACGLLDDQQSRDVACYFAEQLERTLVARAGQVTDVRFPQTVGGFSLNATPREIRLACGVGQYAESDGVAMCSVLPLDPFLTGGGSAIVSFCEGRACEIGLVLGGEPGAVKHIVDQLEKRYGEPERPKVPPIGQCHGTSVPQLLAGSRPTPFRMTWVWNRMVPSGPGSISAHFQCLPDTQEPELIVWYRNGAGIRARLRERDKRNTNY